MMVYRARSYNCNPWLSIGNLEIDLSDAFCANHGKETGSG